MANFFHPFVLEKIPLETDLGDITGTEPGFGLSRYGRLPIGFGLPRSRWGSGARGSNTGSGTKPVPERGVMWWDVEVGNR